MQVASAEPDTTTRYVFDVVRQTTEFVWPYNTCITPETQSNMLYSASVIQYSIQYSVQCTLQTELLHKDSVKY